MQKQHKLEREDGWTSASAQIVLLLSTEPLLWDLAASKSDRDAFMDEDWFGERRGVTIDR